jgi:hypothetical protein
MAEIFGVTLKNVKKFRGLEGEGFSATINGIKVCASDILCKVKYQLMPVGD